MFVFHKWNEQIEKPQIALSGVQRYMTDQYISQITCFSSVEIKISQRKPLNRLIGDHGGILMGIRVEICLHTNPHKFFYRKFRLLIHKFYAGVILILFKEPKYF